MAQLAQPKSTAFSQEEVCVISKASPCAVWAGTKILYSGEHSSSVPLQASGYNFLSGESDIEPVNWSGWGKIRVPELNQLHKVFVFPHEPGVVGRPDYTTLTVGTTSGYPTGHGGCSGKIALIHYIKTCMYSGHLYDGTTSGVPLGCSGIAFASNVWTSGLVDILAFGSEM